MTNAVKARVAEAGGDQAAIRSFQVAMVLEQDKHDTYLNDHNKQADEVSKLEALFNSAENDPFEKLCDDICPNKSADNITMSVNLVQISEQYSGIEEVYHVPMGQMCL